MYCEIHVRGSLAPAWSEWLHGLAITQVSSREAVLSGPIADQSALLGILNRIHAMNVQLISVEVFDRNNDTSQRSLSD